MTIFAHAGHWLVQVAYAAPLVVLGVVLVVGKIRERRRLRAGQAPRRLSGS